MNGWKDVSDKPVVQPDRKLEFDLGHLNCLRVARRPNEPWGMWLTLCGYKSANPTGANPPLDEALEYAASMLEESLAKVRAKQAESSPQVDFPAAVDPVAAIERGD